MIIALLANAASIHTIRWANGIVSRNNIVHLITVNSIGCGLDERIIVHKLKIDSPFGYFMNNSELRRLINTLKPDLLNAHYSTGYGLLARLCGFKPLLLSVWGSDIYDFPSKSFLHRNLVEHNLRSATAIGSTSQCMAKKMAEIFQHPHVFITPFGIDEKIFIPNTIPKTNLKCVIGTVKTLKNIYGIDTLIEAFSLVSKKIDTNFSLHLEITGGGPELAALESLADHLGVADKITFHGPVPHAKVPEMLNRLDIYVALSRFESFGVAILEANACEKPVVVSDADGLAEVTVNGGTGFVVKKDNASSAADAIFKLVNDNPLRLRMGEAGRQNVLKNYSWEKCIDSMLNAYECTIDIHNNK